MPLDPHAPGFTAPVPGAHPPPGAPPSPEPNAVAAAWDRLSPLYQEYHDLPTATVHYGPWSPLESDLLLLGPMAGRRVLELGCGGGQCAIALAHQGAAVTALDVSAVQLAYARQLAAAAGATVEFLLGDVTNLAPLEHSAASPGAPTGDPAAGLGDPVSAPALPSGAFDLVLSVNTFPYIANMHACLAACHRLLRSGGRLIFSLDHPLRACFLDADAPGGDEELSIIPARSYYDARPHRWRWGATGIALQTYHRTIGTWCDLLAASGLTLRRIVEPLPPAATLDAVYSPDDALSPLRLIPHAIIFVAEKP